MQNPSQKPNSAVLKILSVIRPSFLHRQHRRLGRVSDGLVNAHVPGYAGAVVFYASLFRFLLASFNGLELHEQVQPGQKCGVELSKLPMQMRELCSRGSRIKVWLSECGWEELVCRIATDAW